MRCSNTISVEDSEDDHVNVEITRRHEKYKSGNILKIENLIIFQVCCPLCLC